MNNDIEIIKQKVLIQDIAAKAGFEMNRSGFIRSIFKTEKTASLKVYPNNSFYCFASGIGGSIIDFYSALFNVDVPTAIKELKTIAGLDDTNIERRKIVQPAQSVEEKPKDFIGSLSEDERLYFDERFGLVEEASNSEKMAFQIAKNELIRIRLEKNIEIFEEFYRYAIAYSNNAAAIRYLTDQRKIDKKALYYFKVFTFENYNQVSNHLKKMFPIDRLQRSGLFNENGNLIFFKHRIIIPYLHNGRIVYLRGRFFDENGSAQTDQFKYLGVKNDATDLNSPKRFFNVDILKTLTEGSPLYICEGEFDSILWNHFGFPSISINGTGNLPREEMLNRLLKFNIKVVVDKDQAGQTLVDGFYFTPAGEKKYKKENLTEYFSKHKKKFAIVDFGKKDFNDYVAEFYGKK